MDKFGSGIRDKHRGSATKSFNLRIVNFFLLTESLALREQSCRGGNCCVWAAPTGMWGLLLPPRSCTWAKPTFPSLPQVLRPVLWIRTRMDVQYFGKLDPYWSWKLTLIHITGMELWRAVDALNQSVEVWRVCRKLVADSHHHDDYHNGSGQ